MQMQEPERSIFCHGYPNTSLSQSLVIMAVHFWRIRKDGGEAGRLSTWPLQIA
jgi:hypothetical protein